MLSLTSNLLSGMLCCLLGLMLGLFLEIVAKMVTMFAQAQGFSFCDKKECGHEDSARYFHYFYNFFDVRSS